MSHVPLVSTSVETPYVGFIFSYLEGSYVGRASCSHGVDTGFTISSPTSTTTFIEYADSSTPIFHFYEEIIEALTLPYYPWDDMHHYS
jgi:hypothetical protein